MMKMWCILVVWSVSITLPQHTGELLSENLIVLNINRTLFRQWGFSLQYNVCLHDVINYLSQIASLFRFGSLSPVVLCMLYTAFVLPLYDYCNVVWSPTTAKFTSLLERVHSKFVKKLPPSCAPRLSFTLTERRHFHTAIQVFRSVHNYSPSYLLNIFHYSKDITSYCRCNINRLFVPRVFSYKLWQKKLLLSWDYYMEQFVYQNCWGCQTVNI